MFPQMLEAAEKPEPPVVLSRIGAPMGWALEGGSRTPSSAGSSNMGSFASAFLRPNHEEDSSRENRPVPVGEATLPLGKGFVSVVSRRRVPGRDAVEGEDMA